LIINNPFLIELTYSGLQGLANANVDGGLTQTRAPSWDVENLHSKILYVIHDACHHMASSVEIKQEGRLYVTGRHFNIRLQDQTHPHSHLTFVHPSSVDCVQLQRRRCGSSIKTNFGAPADFRTSIVHFFLEVLYSFAIFDEHLGSTDLREIR
jgi:hypothetical protein